MSIFYDQDTSLQPKFNESWSKGERTNFLENWDSQHEAWKKSEIFTSEHNNEAEEFINIVSILKQAGHSDFVNPLDQQFNWQTGEGIDPKEPSFGKSKNQLISDFWNKVTELQKTDDNLKFLLVDAGLDTPENMQKTIAKQTQDAWSNFREINEKATTFGKIGGFGGVMTAAFTDPIMLATIPVSFGYSVPATFGKAALKVALMEGLIGGVAETRIQIKAQPYRKKLGFEDAGIETGLKNIAMVTGASAALSPLLLGVFKAFGRGIDIGKEYLAKMPVEQLQITYKELGNINPKFKDKTLTEYKLPQKDSPFEDVAPARLEHRERLNATLKSIEDGTQLLLPPPKAKINNKILQKKVLFTDDSTIAKVNNLVEKIKKTKSIETSVKTSKINNIATETNAFNKNISKLADDVDNLKEFDVPNEKTFRNQANVLRDNISKSKLGEGIPIATKSDGEQITSVTKTGQELFEEELQDIQMLERLKDCV